MDLMQFEMFVAAVEEGNFRKAADRVFRTQPAVSMALKKLEEEAGVALFDRSERNSYSLTEAGHSLYGYAKRMLCLREEALAEMGQIHKLERSQVTIGTGGGIEEQACCALVKEIASRCADARINVVQDSAENLLRKLRDSQVDLALLPFEPADHGVESIPVPMREVHVITGKNHRWARKREVNRSELASERFAVCSCQQTLNDQIFEELKKDGFKLDIKFEVPTIEGVKTLVHAGLAVTVLPPELVKKEIEGRELCSVRIEDFTLTPQVFLAYRRANARTPAIRAARESLDFQEVHPGLPLAASAAESRLKLCTF